AVALARLRRRHGSRGDEDGSAVAATWFEDHRGTFFIDHLTFAVLQGERGPLLGGCAEGRARRGTRSAGRRRSICRSRIRWRDIAAAGFAIGQREKLGVALPLSRRIKEGLHFARGTEQHDRAVQLAAEFVEVFFFGSIKKHRLAADRL